MSEVDITIVDERDSPDTPSNPGNPILTAIALNGVALAQQPTLLSNLAYTNQTAGNDLAAKGQVANQNAQNKLRLSILANAVNQIQDAGPKEGRSAVDVLTGNELAQTIADLKATLQAFATQSSEN